MNIVRPNGATQNPIVAAAQAFVLYYTDLSVRALVDDSKEPYRRLVDESRNRSMHDVLDGSLDYETMVDALEYLMVPSNEWG